MSQLTKAITRQLQRQYAEPVLKDLNGNWYTGADVLEDLAPVSYTHLTLPTTERV